MCPSAAADLAAALPESLKKFTLVVDGPPPLQDGQAENFMQVISGSFRDGLEELGVTLLPELVIETIGDSGIEALASKIPRNLKRFKLHLPLAGFGDTGATAIARGIPPSLTSLVLSFPGNLILAGGAKALAGVLPPQLQKLDLD